MSAAWSGGSLQASSDDDPPTPPFHLSRRLLQTLALLLEGDAEKEVALKLGLSPHTVHVYVKALYRRFAVNSRGELLAAVYTALQRDQANGDDTKGMASDVTIVGC